MHVCGLRLAGFRSFADAVDIPVGEGLTGLTGANCCGKSSILSAVRWVLGFTDEDPDQAIFCCSETRAHSAEVSLSFSGCRGHLEGPHASQSHLTLSRSLTRAGQDSFSVNGYEAGLRDVKVLLSDAGADIPLLCSRNDLQELMDSEPRQRCGVIQAAAGVSGLLVRYEAISTRLTETRQSMKTLDTRIAELSKRLETARNGQHSRQQHEQRRQKAHLLRAKIFRTRWMQAEGESALARRVLQDVADKCDAHEAARQQAFDALADTTELALGASTDALAALDDLSHARIQQAHNEGKRASAQSLLDQIEAEHTRLEEAVAREESLASEARLLRDHAQAGLSALEEAGYAGIDSPQDTPDTSRDINQKWNAACHKVRSAGQRLQSAQAALTDCAKTLAQRAADTRTDKMTREYIAKLDRRIAAISDQSSSGNDNDIHAARTDARRALNQAHGDCDQRRQMCAQADDQLKTARKNRRELDDALVVQERLVSSLEAEHRILEQLADLEHAAEQKPPDLSWLDPRRDGIEKALRAALGDEVCAPCDDSHQPQHWSGSGGAIGLYLPDEVEPLDTLVASPGHLGKRLAQCGLVKRQDGQRLQTQLHQGQRLVSLEGDMWRWDGFVIRADKESQTTDSDGDIGARLQATSEALKDARGELEKIRAQIQTRTDALVEAESTAQECARALGKEIENVAWQREIVLRAEAGSSQVRAAQESRQAHLAELEAEKKDALETLATLTADSDDTDRDDVARDDVARDDVARDDVAGIAQTLIAAHAEQAVARRALDALEQQRKDAVRRRAELAEDKQSWTERADLAAKRLDTLAASRRRIADRITATRSTIAALDAAAIGLAQRATEAEEAEGKRRGRAKHLRDKYRKCAEVLAGLASGIPPAVKEAEERLESALRHEDEIGREIRRRLRCDPAALIASMSQDDTVALASIETAESELEALESAIASETGAEDVAGHALVEDIARLETAVSEVVREREIAGATAARLDAGLVELGKTVTERITRMFEFVDSHFRVLFPALVEGGEGHLELIPDRSVLNTGLGVHVRSGHSSRVRPAAQLSGNEKVLTALALVLSIFTVRPALFGVLDEVDAGLDAARIQRLCTVLRHIADHTGSRFLLTSSNALIASQCDTVLSATMTGDGKTSVDRVETGRRAKVVAA